MRITLLHCFSVHPLIPICHLGGFFKLWCKVHLSVQEVRGHTEKYSGAEFVLLRKRDLLLNIPRQLENGHRQLTLCNMSGVS